MATAGVGFGTDQRGGAVPLDGVVADMRAIFGPDRAASGAARAQVRSASQPPVQCRSAWGRAGAVLLAGGGAGALLGWWVLSATPVNAPRAPVRAAVASSQRARDLAPTAAVAIPAGDAGVTDDAAPPAERPDTAPHPSFAGGDAPLGAYARSSSDEARGDALVVADASRVAAPRYVPAAPAPPAAVPASRPAYAPPAPRAAYAPPARYADQAREDDGCGRYGDACTGADVRDAEMQFRAAYAAAEDAGADPRALADVRRRWARMWQVDRDRPDRLVTDFARLAGRLGWLADNADGPE